MGFRGVFVYIKIHIYILLRYKDRNKKLTLFAVAVVLSAYLCFVLVVRITDVQNNPNVLANKLHKILTNKNYAFINMIKLIYYLNMEVNLLS